MQTFGTKVLDVIGQNRKFYFKKEMFITDTFLCIHLNGNVGMKKSH